MQLSLKLKRTGVLLLFAFFPVASAVGVTVSSDGSAVCPQNSATFTCTVDHEVKLQWIAEPFVTEEQNEVVFLPSEIDTNPTRTATFSGVTFHAVLTQSDPVPGSPGFFTLRSTLSTTASATTNGTVIVCREPFSGESDNVTLKLQIPPPQPSGAQYNVISSGTSVVTGDIEWNSAMGSSVDNFTITVSSLDGSTDIMTTVESSPLSNVILYYNTHYIISIRGSNCAGSSKPATLLFMESGCPPPRGPVSGSVSGFTSASVGSEVTYHCNTGLAMVGERVAMCTQDLVWVPNVSEVMCQHPLPGDCGDPGELTNGMVIFSNGTRDGSVITFQCDPGLSLVGDRVSQCRSGQWTVLPQDVLCTVFNETKLHECKTDSSLPTRTSHMEQFSTAEVVAITGVTGLVSLTVGALLGALFHHLITRAQGRPQSQSKTQTQVPLYEDIDIVTTAGTESAAIEVKCNEAYGPVRQQEIPTRPNWAYDEHVQM